MTVKVLSNEQKVRLIKFYKSKELNQKQLASYFGVSERTVNRVLNEVGIATAVPRLKGEAYQVMQLLKDYKLDYASLKKMLDDKALIMSYPAVVGHYATI